MRTKTSQYFIEFEFDITSLVPNIFILFDLLSISYHILSTSLNCKKKILKPCVDAGISGLRSAGSELTTCQGS